MFWIFKTELLVTSNGRLLEIRGYLTKRIKTNLIWIFLKKSIEIKTALLIKNWNENQISYLK
jgi:hypothetical protein